MSQNRVLALALAGVLALGLTACVPDFGFTQGGSGGGNGGGPTTGATPGSDEADDENDEDTFATDPASCLVDTWRADNEFFLAAMQQFGGQVKSVDGLVTVDFAADGSLTTTYNAWTMKAVEEGVEVTVTRNGVDTGEYSASDEVLSLRDVHVTSVVTLSGQGFDMSVDAVPADYHEVSYTCDATTASVTTPDGTLKLHRM